MGIRRSVPCPIIYAELGRQPLIFPIFCSLIHFWNKIDSAPPDSLIHQVLLDNVRCASAGVSNWYQQFTVFLTSLGVHMPTDAAHPMPTLWRPHLTQKLSQQLHSIWEGLPSVPAQAPSDQVKLATYLAWFANVTQHPGSHGPVSAVRPAYYWSLPVGYSRLTTLLRFRMGCHYLAIETGRWQRPAVPRHSRHCPHCPGQVQDELHWILHCSHTGPVRAHFPALFSAVSSMRDLFSHSTNHDIVDLVSQMCALQGHTRQ